MVRISATVSEVNVIKEEFDDVSKKVEAALVKSFPNSKWDVQVNESVTVVDGEGSEHINVDCYEVSAIREADACKVVEKALADKFGANADIYVR